eukprot:Pgem_evm2s5344
MTRACAQYYSKALQPPTTTTPIKPSHTPQTTTASHPTNSTPISQPHTAYITQQQHPHIIPPPPHQQYMYTYPNYYIPPPQTPQTPQARPPPKQNYYIDTQHDTHNDIDHTQPTQQ